MNKDFFNYEMKGKIPLNEKGEIVEELFKPNNHLEYLDNKYYHSSEKGCQCKITSTLTSVGGVIINKFCVTHNINCSKSGWELGWYGGTDSTIKECDDCGKRIPLNTKNVRCNDCLKIIKDINYKNKLKELIKIRLKYRQIKILSKTC